MTGNIRLDQFNRMFYNTPFRPDNASTKSKILINFHDSIPDDTLTIYFSNEKLPLAFSRAIHTPVCMDTLCRVVDIILYWEITGKYLGFSLPDGTELTKKKHTPFTDSDYKRLNQILSDSLSQLGFYTPAEIHPVKQEVVKTDGITGATIPDLQQWIVPEAAYSSYTLWHITYGQIRDTVVAYTKNHLLSNELIFNILQSHDPYNQTKALQWISQTNGNKEQFIENAFQILKNGNYLSAGQALKFLKSCTTDQKRLQKEVIQLLDDEDFRIKNLVIAYFNESVMLAPDVARELINRLKSENYYIVNVVLNILNKRYFPDYNDQQNLCLLLDSKNVNIANRGYYFLLLLPNQSPYLLKQLNRYRRKNL